MEKRFFYLKNETTYDFFSLEDIEKLLIDGQFSGVEEVFDIQQIGWRSLYDIPRIALLLPWQYIKDDHIQDQVRGEELCQLFRKKEIKHNTNIRLVHTAYWQKLWESPIAQFYKEAPSYAPLPKYWSPSIPDFFISKNLRYPGRRCRIAHIFGHTLYLTLLTILITLLPSSKNYSLTFFAIPVVYAWSIFIGSLFKEKYSYSFMNLPRRIGFPAEILDWCCALGELFLLIKRPPGNPKRGPHPFSHIPHLSQSRKSFFILSWLMLICLFLFFLLN